MEVLRSYRGGWSRQVAHALAVHADMAYGEGIGDLIEHGPSDTQCYLKDYGTHAVLSFRGTSSLRDVLLDLGLDKTWFKRLVTLRNTLVPKIRWWPDNSHVHRGFATAFNSVRPAITDALAELGDDARQNLFITGHSLGASLATLAADRFGCVSLMTFGSPRTGGRMFARRFELKTAGKYFRIFNRSDIVARVPSGFRFKHVGTPVFIDHKGLIWIRPGWKTRLTTFWKNIVNGSKADLFRNHGTAEYLEALE